MSASDLLLGLYNDQIGAITGPLGVAIYICAYFLLQIGALRGHGAVYPVFITIAAGCVLYTQQGDFNGPSATIQASFIVISLIGLSQLALRRYTIRFTEDERVLLETHLPNLDPVRARRLLRRGRWTRFPPGQVLTVPGQPVGSLVYVTQGQVRYGPQEREVYTLRDGFFVGEASCLSAAPETGRYVAETPLRGFQIDADVLRRLAQKDVVIRLAVQTAMAEDSRRKLLLADAAHRTVIENLDCKSALGSDPP